MSVSAVLASSIVASVVRAYVDGGVLGADYTTLDTPRRLRSGIASLRTDWSTSSSALPAARRPAAW